MEVRPLKQKAGSYNCVAVCAAMATGCLPEDFENRIPHAAPYCDMEFLVFVWELGYGTVFGFAEVHDLDPHRQRLGVNIDLEEYMAYIAVESETNPDLTHAILWDGHQIYDPNPMVPNGRPLTDYKILKLFPFTKEPVGDPLEEMKELTKELAAEMTG